MPLYRGTVWNFLQKDVWCQLTHLFCAVNVCHLLLIFIVTFICDIIMLVQLLASCVQFTSCSSLNNIFTPYCMFSVCSMNIRTWMVHPFPCFIMTGHLMSLSHAGISWNICWYLLKLQYHRIFAVMFLCCSMMEHLQIIWKCSFSWDM